MLTTFDVALIGVYLLVGLAVGFYVRGAAGEGLKSYFLAGRSLPWWWLGTSMVATTFASDTPLVVTGFVAQHGISGNWFWWSTAVGLVLLGVVFARNWQRSEVITDAELAELRYDGRAATALRGFKALFSSLFVNCIVLGWVFAAMAKITRPFVHWQAIVGPSLYLTLQEGWPNFLMYQTIDNTLTVLLLVLVVMLYSSVGGLRGVVVTDLLQFVIAMVAAVVFAWYAVDHVGGLQSMWTRLDELYPEGTGAPSAQELTAFWPRMGEGAMMSFGAFAAGLGVLWWANSQVDGSGYLSQRVCSARDEEAAERGALWFCFAHFVLRTWPWVIVALVALIAFPLHEASAAGALLKGDREMAYPLLMQKVLPPGVLGFVLLSLIAAFMSTVDTHINWGASYLTGDLYRRFMRPQATERELVRVSRVSVVLLTFLALVIAAQIDQVGDVWKFYFAMMSGLGVPHLLRWIWWRANAWTEISGMLMGLLLSLPAYLLNFAQAYPTEYVLSFIAGTSALTSILVTLLTPPVAEKKLREFAKRVRPIGFWKDLSPARPQELRLRLMAWATGVVCIYASMFAVGLLLKLQILFALCLLTLGIVAGALTLSLLKRASSPPQEDRSMKSEEGVRSTGRKAHDEQSPPRTCP